MLTENEITSAEQEILFELRKTFLEAIVSLKGTPCKIVTYDQSTLEATFSEWNSNGTEMLVTDLKTPTNMKVDVAVLRTPDIIAVHFDRMK